MILTELKVVNFGSLPINAVFLDWAYSGDWARKVGNDTAYLNDDRHLCAVFHATTQVKIRA